MDPSIRFDADLIRRYDTAGPRYTSYPTAVEFHEGFGVEEYRACAAAAEGSGRPLSLYFHSHHRLQNGQNHRFGLDTRRGRPSRLR